MLVIVNLPLESHSASALTPPTNVLVDEEAATGVVVLDVKVAVEEEDTTVVDVKLLIAVDEEEGAGVVVR